MVRALLVVSLLAGPALADDVKPPGNTHAEGDYGGVQPGQGKKPEPGKGKPKKPPAKGTLGWVGFEVKDGGSQVFLQSGGAFEVAQHVDNGTVVVELGGLSRLGQNTWRPIDTRFFDTPISRIVARRVGAAKATKSAPAHGAGVEVRITFKNPKDAKEGSLRTATEADGLFYAYLTFAGGGAAPAQPMAPGDVEK